MKTKTLQRLLAGLLILLLLVSLLPFSRALAAEDSQDSSAEDTAASAQDAESSEAASADEEVHISTAEDFLSFAESCTLDTWSQGKTFVLDNDISLDGLDFSPVPTFGGTFLGNGHCIRGLNLTDSFSPTGLFSIVQDGGRIEKLNVEGSITGESDSLDIGGIAGENYGQISGCSFTGTISGTRNVGGIVGENMSSGLIVNCQTGGALFGENMTGGIAGYNYGAISGCQNNMYVNIESTDPSIRLQDLDLDFSLDLTKLTQISTAGIATDTGGIAGYSSGSILNSKNLAAIGYQHIGYNVGGIAGRSCGYILGCENQGAICGRKDVGGIVGQMEPYIQAVLTESMLDSLQKQLNELNDLVDQATKDAEGSAGGVSSRLNNISGSVQNALDEVGDIKANITASGSVSGSGSHESSTVLDAAADLVDADAAGSSGSSLTIEHEPGSVTIETGSGSSATVDLGQAADAVLDHSGTADGQVDGTASIVATPDLGGLTSAVNGISGQLSLLNGALTGAVSTVATDIRSINDKFSEISDSLFDAIENASSTVEDLVTDASTTDVDAITLGKIAESSNEAAIYGDINVGGIAGHMSIESTLDPEDDLSSDLSGSSHKQYEYRAVIQSCANRGTVTSKRDYAGGIAGRMDLGLITNSENYGPISSENGSYVGGIAGVTSATVRSSFAKCTLSGKKYVGGITGSGVAETATGNASTVAGCYSFVEITSATEYAGAISGADAGTYLENCFVSDTLAGINRQSYAGVAESISYETLMDLDTLPDDMRSLTLKFVIDDEVISATSFSYGDSFDDSIFPELPEKEGYSASWDHTDLTDLHFDTTVTAVYTSYTPSLASSNTREDGRPIVLAEGAYTDGATVTITSQSLTPGAFGIRSGSIGSRISSYFTDAFPAMTMNWEVIEQWVVEISGTDTEGATIRYLAPDQETDHLRVYVRQNGKWEEVSFGTFGTYLTIPLQTNSAEIAIVRTVHVYWFFIAGAALLVLLLVLILLLIHRAHNKRKAASQPAEPTEEPPVSPTPAAEATATSEADAALLARAEKAEDMIAQLELELQALRSGAAAPVSAPAASAEATPEPEAPQDEQVAPSAPAAAPDSETKAPKKRKKKHWWIPVLLVLLVGTVAAGFFLNSDVKSDVEAYRLLSDYLDTTPSSADLSVEAALNGTIYRTTAEIGRIQNGTQTITCVQQGDVALYYVGDTLYLENGNAYEIGSLYPDYSSLLTKASSLYQLIHVETSKSGSQKVYTIHVSGEDASSLLAILAPTAENLQETITTLTLELYAADNTLQSLHFSSSASLQSGASLDAVLTIQQDAQAFELPSAVQEAITSGTTGDSTITENLFRLLQAGSTLASKNSFSSDIAIAANCGPLVVNTTLQYDQALSAGQTIGCIRKDSLAVYFSGEKLCDSNGYSVSTGSELVDTAKLGSLAYELLLNGSFTCSKAGTSYIYTLQLDEEGMQSVALAILPEAKDQALELTSGTISLTITNDEIASIQCTCNGLVQLALTKADVSFSGKITLTQRDVSIPQAVLDALRS